MNAAIRPLLQAFPVGQFASASSLFDVVNVQEPGSIDEYSGNIRFDFMINDKNRMYARYQRDQGYGYVTATSTGSSIIYGAVPQNAMVALNQVLKPNLLNEIKVGLNAPKTRVYASTPNVPGVDLSGVTISLSGVVSLGGTGGQITSQSATYTIPLLLPGTYYLEAWVDMNGGSNIMAGDYVYSTTITIGNPISDMAGDITLTGSNVQP